jgi:hypothetical protein
VFAFPADTSADSLLHFKEFFTERISRRLDVEKKMEGDESDT